MDMRCCRRLLGSARNTQYTVNKRCRQGAQDLSLV